jgi:hypothetical protein
MTRDKHPIWAGPMSTVMRDGGLKVEMVTVPVPGTWVFKMLTKPRVCKADARKHDYIFETMLPPKRL